MNIFLENSKNEIQNSQNSINPKSKNISKLDKVKKITFLHLILSIISLTFLSIYPITTNYLTKFYYSDFEKNSKYIKYYIKKISFKFAY